MASKCFEDKFKVHVISTTSMEIFDQNTLASFRSFFNDEIKLSGDWRVALSEIIFPTKIHHITNGILTPYSLSGLEDRQRNSSGVNVVSRSYNGERLGVMPGTFHTVSQLLATVKRILGYPKFSYREIKNSGKIEIVFGKYEGIRFPSDEVPSIIGFKGVPDGQGTHIGYKMDTIANKLLQKDDTKAFMGDFPADLCAGKHFKLIYTNMIDYQYVADAKAHLLRIIDSKQRLKIGSVCELEPTHRIVFFSNLDYKKLLSNTIQSISIELRTETGQLVPFSGTCKVILTLQFNKFGEQTQCNHTITINHLHSLIFRDTIDKEVAALELWQVVWKESLYLLQEKLLYQQQNVLEKNF